jgi:hypothetical protein
MPRLSFKEPPYIPSNPTPQTWDEVNRYLLELNEIVQGQGPDTVGNLDYENGVVGLLDEDVIKDYHIDWGTDANQVSTTDMPEGSNLYYTAERVDAQVNSLLTAGTGISLTYDDGAGTLTIAAVASGIDHSSLANRGWAIAGHLGSGAVAELAGFDAAGVAALYTESDYILVDGTRAFTGNQSFGDNNITNVGDISLDSISSDSGSTITVLLGTDAGDDFIVGNNNAFVVEGDTDYVGFGTLTPACDIDIVKNPAAYRTLFCITDQSAASQRSVPMVAYYAYTDLY